MPPNPSPDPNPNPIPSLGPDQVVPFFTDLTPATLQRLAPLFSTQLATRGTHLIREGEEGSVLYVLAQGACSIQKWTSVRKGSIEVARIDHDSEHTYFGELRRVQRLQPYVPQAATLRATGCNPTYHRRTRSL